MPSSGRVFIGNISSSTRERDVEKFFKEFGKIRDVVLKQGYGFVEFDDTRDAEDAVKDLDGRELNGDRLRVELARSRDFGRDRGGGGGGGFGDRGGGRDRGYDRGSDRGGDRPRGRPPGQRTNYRIVVENLSSRTSWQDLKDFFRSSGDITYTNVNVPSSGYGIVEFADKKGLEYAMDNKHDLELDGKKLKIKEEGSGSDRGGSRGGDRGGRGRSDSRSKSRSRSRSRSRGRSDRRREPSRSRSRSPKAGARKERDSRSRSKD